MAQKSADIQGIRKELDSLRTRLQALSEKERDAQEATPPEPSPTQAPADGDDRSPGLPFDSRGLSAKDLALVRSGISDLSMLTKLKDFPDYFVKVAKRTDLRLLLLKRWTSGLQVFVEQNIKMPAEAKRKRRDGRAPIPTKKGDVFEAVGHEAAVYAGPVPLKHFPLDLTIMLGRGSRDRRIVILPLPSQNHWNTFLYLDADASSESTLSAVEILAHFALMRMCLLQKGVRLQQGRVPAMLKAELYRRQQAADRRGNTTPEPDIFAKVDPAPETRPESAADATDTAETNVRTRDRIPPEIDPFVPSDTPADKQIPLAPDTPLNAAADEADAITDAVKAEAKEDTAGTAASLPDWDQVAPDGILTPELILHHSGELPALPKAACHIMAVIEDPRTTATRLEKALAMDQTLTAKVLRIANSPFYGAVREIRTVSEAIVRLGFITIRNWTLVTATKSVFLGPGAGMLYQNIWRQSVLSAMAGQMVGQLIGRVEPENIFIGGLMQNIGQLVLARSHPELFQQIMSESAENSLPYHEVERQRLGFDHGELGALLINEWNLSQDLEDAVRWHHNFRADDARNAQVAAMIALGEEVALCGANYDDEQTEVPEGEEDIEQSPPPSDPAVFLGVSATKVEDLKQQASRLHIDPSFFN